LSEADDDDDDDDDGEEEDDMDNNSEWKQKASNKIENVQKKTKETCYLSLYKSSKEAESQTLFF
jgi:hypothetical protein